MAEDQIAEVAPRYRKQALSVLTEKLATQAGTVSEMVEEGHAVADYLPPDPLLRHRFMVQLERAFGIPIDGTRFDSVSTVGELADLIALKLQARKSASEGRAYVICYRDTAGRLVESHVRAKNHLAAIEALRAEGLKDVVSVERDEDDEHRVGKVHNTWSGCVLPILAAIAVAGGAVALFWWRRG